MRSRTRGRIALALFVASSILSAFALWLQLAYPNPEIIDDWGFRGFEGILGMSFAVVGLIVLRRSPNPAGWLISLLGLGSSLQYLTEEYGQAALLVTTRLPAGPTVAWIAEWIWVPLMAAIGYLLLVFPDDQVTSRVGRGIVITGAAAALGSFSAAAFLNPHVETFEIDNPYALNVDPNMWEATFGITTLLLMISILAAAISLIMRLRSAAGIRRQQLKWFSFTALFTGVSLPFAAIPSTSDVASVLAIGGLVLMAIACAIAIFRYRLYDIDVVINRTLVYGLLTAALLASYLIIVVTLSRVLEPVTRDSDIAVAASTLAVAALFRPLRARIQGFIDRRFYRAKYDATRALAVFGTRLRGKVDIDAVRGDILTVIGSTVQPSHASLWIRAQEVRE